MAGDAIESLSEVIRFTAAPGAVAVLGWWLKTKFTEISDQSRNMLASHEVQDERRHRQNLVRFAKINSKLGISDFSEGNGESEDE